ncbi:lipopolysaccharide biosynthesis protein [Shewanella woodyi]|uniref:lipopolysaccharide biosynthesis protein n=1 Tax=Shewanella woodyi TaxID=60961 RepID=UPI0007EC079A|nr:oligosaccharide flippase family protein [Shewanella woodyi]
MILIKKFINYAGFSALTTFFGLLTLPVLTAFLAPSEYGILGVTLSFLALLLPFSTLSNQQNVQVTKTKEGRAEYSHFWDSLCSLVLILACSLFCVVCIAVYFNKFPSVFLLIPILSLVRALRLLKQAELTVIDKDFLFGLSTLLISVFAFFTTFGIFYFIEATAMIRIACLAFAELLVVFCVLKFRFNFVYSPRVFKQIYNVGLPLIISTLPAWLINEASRIFILNYHSLELVGVYTLAFQISVIYLQFNTALGNTFVKKIFNDISILSSKKFIFQVSLIQLVCALIFVLLLVFFGKSVLPVSYGAAIPIATILTFGVLLQSFGLLPTYYFSYHKVNRFRLYALSVAAVIATVLNYIYIPKYGIDGAAFIFVVSMAFYSACLFFFVVFYSNKVN